MKIVKKKEGSIDKFAVPLIMIIAFAICIILNINTSYSLENKDKVDTISREYLLKMETQGYLVTSDKVELVNELQALGVKNISISPSCFLKVDYGKRVTLDFSCEIPIKSMENTTWDNAKTKIEYVKKEYKRSSTSKH